MLPPPKPPGKNNARLDSSLSTQKKIEHYFYWEIRHEILFDFLKYMLDIGTYSGRIKNNYFCYGLLQTPLHQNIFDLSERGRKKMN